MMTFQSCSNPPFASQGIAVSGLYFVQAPGAPHLDVYVRYPGQQGWVPLYIGLPGIPSLQQVRDRDRNITLSSGSYEDAHLYLRSAAGNNMTTAYFTNANGGGIQSGNTEGYAPLQLQPAGGLLTYGGQEVATRTWVQGEGYLTEEQDPTVPAFVKAISQAQISNWNAAFSWGNHASAGYEKQSNKVTTLSGATNVTYPSSLAVQQAIAAQGLQQVTAINNHTDRAVNIQGAAGVLAGGLSLLHNNNISELRTNGAVFISRGPALTQVKSGTNTLTLTDTQASFTHPVSGPAASASTQFVTLGQLNSTVANYIPTADKGADNGVATLGTDGKIPQSQLPALAIVNTFVVASQAAMLALSQAEQGDIAVRTDINKSFVLLNNVPGQLASWQELLTPTAPQTNLSLGAATATTRAINNSNGTGLTLPAVTTTAAGLMTSADKTKLNGVQAGATANQTDAYLLNRANHTGEQAISTVTGLQTELNSKLEVETDPTVPAYVKSITATEISNWNTAFSWGDYRQFGLGAIGTSGVALPGNTLDDPAIPNGLYAVLTSTVGNPASSSGAVIIERTGANSYVTQKLQLINAGDIDRMFIRHYMPNTSTWSTWKELYHTGSSLPIPTLQEVTTVGNATTGPITITNGVSSFNLTTNGSSIRTANPGATWARQYTTGVTDGTNDIGVASFGAYGPPGAMTYGYLSSSLTNQYSSSDIKFVDGKVGINLTGSTAPAYRLDVNGSVRLNTVAGTGQGLVVASSEGLLSRQALPDFSAYMTANTTQTGLTGDKTSTGVWDFRLKNNSWYEDAEGTSRIYFGNSGTSANGLIFRLSNPAQSFRFFNTSANSVLDITSTGSLSKTYGSTRVFDKVYQGYSNASPTSGILSIYLPQANTAATMFNVLIRVYGYQNHYVGEFNIAFYKQTATVVHISGRSALLTSTDDFPTDVVKAGIDVSGNLRINIGEANTNWGQYLSFEVSKVETKFSGYNSDWSQGWNSEFLTVEPTDYSSLVSISVERSATRNWVTSQIPLAQTLSIGASAGEISISGGNTVALSTLSRWGRPDADAESLIGLTVYVNSTGSTGYPNAIGSGFRLHRAAGSSYGTLDIWQQGSVSSATGPRFRYGTGGTSYSPWYTFASEEWVASQGFTTNTGTVTSVALSVPTGLTVTGSPVTSAGTLAIGFTAGYSLPTTTAQANWTTAFGWGNHATAGYEQQSNKSTTLSSPNNTTFPTTLAVANAIATSLDDFVPLAQKGAANGVASLNAEGKIPNGQLPAIAITETFVVASQAAMLALAAAETGDIAVRTDLNKSFILQQAPPGTLSNWVELLSPTVANTDQLPEGAVNLYFTTARARTSLSAGTGITYNATTGVITNAAPNATHTGDVTGATVLTIASGAVTYAKFQQVPTQTLLGRGATGTGAVGAVTLGANLSLSTGNILSATDTTYSGSASVVLSGTAFQRAALTGDVTAAVNSNATTIAANAVTTAKIANGAVTDAKVTDVAWSKVTGAPIIENLATSDLTIPAVVRILSIDPAGVFKIAHGVSSLSVQPGGLFLSTIVSGTTNSIILSNSSPGINMQMGSAYNANLSAPSLSANRSYQFPNASGTLALISDINTYIPSASIILSGSAFQRAALTGDVTAAANSNATTIATNAVTTAKIANGAVTDTKIADVAWSKITGAPAIPTATDFVTTNTTQSGLNGNKTWGGSHTFGGNLTVLNSRAAFSFTGTTEGVGYPNTIASDPNNYIERSIVKVTTNNNGLFFFGDATSNARRFGIQSAHYLSAFSTAHGRLDLNPFGGTVSVGPEGLVLESSSNNFQIKKWQTGTSYDDLNEATLSPSFPTRSITYAFAASGNFPSSPGFNHVQTIIPWTGSTGNWQFLYPYSNSDSAKIRYRNGSSTAWADFRTIASEEWVAAQGFLTSVSTLQQVLAAGNVATGMNGVEIAGVNASEAPILTLKTTSADTGLIIKNLTSSAGVFIPQIKGVSNNGNVGLVISGQGSNNTGTGSGRINFRSYGTDGINGLTSGKSFVFSNGTTETLNIDYLGNLTSTAWAGGGNQMMVANNSGTVSLQAMPVLVEADPIYTATIPNQMMYKGQIGDAEDLNNYLTIGIYHQSYTVQAGSGSNYPTASAGVLEVMNSGNANFIYQQYTTLGPSNLTYTRARYAGNWSAWKQLATIANLPTVNNSTITVTAGTGMSGGGSFTLNQAGAGTITLTNSAPNATHTGDVSGSTVLTIAANAITTAKIANAQVSFAKMQNIVTNSLVGRHTAGTGAPESIVLGSGLSLSGNTLNATAANQWQDIAGYHYGSAASALNFDGLHTNGGYASKYLTLTADMSLPANVEFVNKLDAIKHELTLPDPAAYPGRVISISNNGTGTGIIGLVGHPPRLNISNTISELRASNLTDATPNWIEIQSVYYAAEDIHYWIVTKHGSLAF